MTDPDSESPRRKRRRLNPDDTGPYVLKPVLENLPLETEGNPEDVNISCVEYWNNNLYIGTSASEILHYVCIPSDPEDDAAEPAFILASRLQPSAQPSNPPLPESKGVLQILLLPGPAKACVLCDGLVTFYSLPELSPAFGTNKIPNCRWIGGIDANQDPDAPTGQVITAALANRIMLVRVGEELRRVGKSMEFPDCCKSVRRDTIACVADSHSYALLEVEHQQKIPLFHISSLDETKQSPIGKIEDLPAQTSPLPSRNSSLAHRPSSPANQRGHDRSTSLGNLVSNMTLRPSSPRPVSQDLTGLRTPDLTAGDVTPTAARSPERKGSPTTSPTRKTASDPHKEKPLPSPPKHPALLKPHIVSPTPTEFLLTTGTKNDESGVGMFVNVDGDVVRGTLDFESYPECLVLDDPLQNPSNGSDLSSGKSVGYILAVITRFDNDQPVKGLEIQRWDVNAGETTHPKSWLPIPFAKESNTTVGLLTTMSTSDHMFAEVGIILQSVRLLRPGEPPRRSNTPSEKPDPRTKISVERVEEEKDLFEGQDGSSRETLPQGWETKRNKEEAAFVRRFGIYQSQTLLWARKCIWRVVRNPLALQLEASLENAVIAADRLASEQVLSMLKTIRNQEAKTESEFFGLNYIRQKASLMLFQDILAKASAQVVVNEAYLRDTESSLMEGGLDPRVVLLLIPLLRKDVLQSAQGLWVNRGVAVVAEEAMSTVDENSMKLPMGFYTMIRRYLTAWQGKADSEVGSITEVDLVSASVDAALLHLLLHLDSELAPNSPALTSVRTKTNNVVDNWKGSFSRAVALLEQYKRLFVLSRLYQSRKLAKDVLATWKRVSLGELDAGGEISPAAAESRIRQYLTKLHDNSLVEEYGIWLATRNPPLAVAALTDKTSRVRLPPSRLIPLLKSKAPGAVQPYLEHLVFSQSLTQFADDLVGYYLDSVLSVLESSEPARQSLAQSYSDYRALEPPKPTYVAFITDNAPDDEEWWQARLRLLQLLGGGSYAASSCSSPNRGDLQYSVETVLKRLAPFSSYLVSESIILDARQGRHEEALRLLVLGLGDYDTAIRYCYFGGPAASSTPAVTIDASSLPSLAKQKELFNHLLVNFLDIEDEESRLERTGMLLSKFAKWFDAEEVLTTVPEGWNVKVLLGFWEKILRRLEVERVQASVVKGLAAGLNLRAQAEFVAGCEKIGGMVERDGGQAPGGDQDIQRRRILRDASDELVVS